VDTERKSKSGERGAKSGVKEGGRGRDEIKTERTGSEGGTGRERRKRIHHIASQHHTAQHQPSHIQYSQPPPTALR
jgi:hypothetical protein